MRHKNVAYILGLVLFSAVVVIFTISSLDQGSKGVEVIQCTNQSNTCEESIITRYRVDCSPYNAWNDRSALDCNETKKGIDNVSLVTDAANYVKAPVDDADYSTDVVNQTGRYPWDLEFLPSGNRIWTNKNGTIRIYNGEEIKVVDSLEVIENYELGLLGLAIDPDFADNDYIYVYYTGNKTDRKVGKLNKTVYRNYVYRFTLTDTGLEKGKKIIGLPGSKYHSGGRLEFGPDNKLYVSTGESGMLYKASNKSNLAGKILRLNTDGTVPGDNPFEETPVYSMGPRNPQGLAWSPEGRLYHTEHGQWRHDEINRVVPGNKYGWSGYRCRDRKKLFPELESKVGDVESYYSNTPPVHCWDEWTMAPSGATFVRNQSSPWHGDLFVAGLRGKQIMRFVFSEGEIVDNKVFYTSAESSNMALRIRDVEYRNGSLYAISDIRGMVKITPN